MHSRGSSAKAQNNHLKAPMQVAMVSVSYIILFLALPESGTASQCRDRACSPPMGNLATGRKLHTLTNRSGPSPLCPALHHLCHVPHPPAHMTDDPFLHPGTWWASEVGVEEEEIRLDLETQFYLTHVVLLFRSPRPAAMMLERSLDFAKTWEPLKFFAKNCSRTFSLLDDVSQPGAPCTSRYSSATPCSEGEVIFRKMGPSSGMDNPYSPEALALLTVTNLRIRLLGTQSCPSPVVPSHPNLAFLTRVLPTPTPITPNIPRPSSIAPNLPRPSTAEMASFSIYTLLAQGTCLCHGHAEQCLPHPAHSDTLHQGKMVQGRCMCLHHTAGEHCEKCAPLFNDRPWRPANGSSGEPHPCQKCECHGHADSCHFSLRVWKSSGGTSGGVCDNCRHNTEGRRCQRCCPGYHRNPAASQNSPHVCTRCWCDPQGSMPARGKGEGLWCHPRSGHCQCRPGVGGTSCSHCLPGHWGFGEEGCRPCMCPQNCDPITGRCQEKDPHAVVYIPIGGKIPDITHILSNDNERVWSEELPVSALHGGKCSCKEKKLRTISDLCKMKYAYVIKASVLSAHDKGSHAEVWVKVRKVLRSGQVALSQGTHTLYPLSWTSRGCTCPVLNPGMEYLLAGPEEAESGRLLVTVQSVVVPWTPWLGGQVTEGLRQGCP
ncbi:netrin-4 [Megalops cyprinoides]|uniref:netrin-4 n=1 Tax=Megalops cyprinoides TaxID=118141 RepID=UPI0018643C04|nr:netrin-4 [Megalops cyprinoides]